MDYMMPYLVQVTKDYTENVDMLLVANKAREAVDAENEAQAAEMGVNMMMSMLWELLAVCQCNLSP